MDTTKSSKFTNSILVLVRIATILLVVSLFVPGMNPSKISGLINKNLSLFTSGMFYKQLTANFGRSINKGWVSEGTLKLLFALWSYYPEYRGALLLDQQTFVSTLDQSILL